MLSSAESEINNNQFVTLNTLKDAYGFSDGQDDSILLTIVSNGNNELKKKLITVVDDITSLEGTSFFDKAKDVALVFCLSQIRRDINQMYDASSKILKDYESQVETLLGDIRAHAPKRTSLEAVTRNVPFEDDYFAERHLP